MSLNPRCCPSCGSALPANAPDGICPRCLLQNALGGDGPEPYRPEISVSFQPGRSSVLASLAESIGGIRRVLLRDTDPGEEPSPVIRPASPEMPGREDRSGRYQLFGEIAHGGMGAILRGRDTDLGRDLVVKVLLEAHKDKPELIRRFVEEAQIGGQLQHPGVVPIYDIGTFADRRPFFTMKLVKGQTLADLLQGRKSPTDGLPRLLSIFEQVCQTMAYAHIRGVIHRDLKPSNIMVGGFGEVQVMDWGLAKVLPRGGVVDDEQTQPQPAISVIQTARSGSDADASEIGSVLGTPAYMAPEQARGEVDRVGERADVFGLGSILCEILTGQPAFTGRSSAEVMRKAARGELSEALARLDGYTADPELIALTRHCLAPEREDRPRNAREVADAITAYLTGVQERLRQTELARVEANARAAEERKRHKLTAALAASIIGTIVVGGGGWFWIEGQRRQGAERVDLALREAEVFRTEAERKGDDPSRWLQARDAAHAVERLQADARDDPTRRKIRKLVENVTAAATAAENDRKLLDKLVDIRSSREDDPDGAATDAAYTLAFREAGVDLAAFPSAEAGAMIKVRPASVAVALTAAIDDWARVRLRERHDQSGTERLAETASAADPDPWRNRLRIALYSSKGDLRLDTLRELARGAKIDELPPVSLELLGTALFSLGDRKMAETVLRDAQRRYPRDVWINYELARCLIRMGRREEAIRYYMAARSIRPETAHMLAHHLDAKGESNEAIAVFQDLVRLRPGNGTYLVCLGQVLEDRGRTKEADAVFDNAIMVLREKVRQKPSFAEAHGDLGRALRSKGKPEEAIAEYREAIRLGPDSSIFHSNLGSVLRSQRKLEDAVAAYREAIRRLAGYSNAHLGLAHALTEQGKKEEAIAEYREAVRLDPSDAMSHTGLGNALAVQGKQEEAIAQFREAIRLKADYVWAHLGLGSALMKQGKLDAGIASYREAIRLKPAEAAYHESLGISLADQGKLTEAIAEFREAIRLKPDEPAGHNNLGLALAKQGKLEGAIAAYREAIRLKPDESAAYNNLGLALAKQGKLEEAVAAYREAIRLKPDESAAHGNLAMALGKTGKYLEAIACCREAIRLNPRDDSAHNTLGQLLYDTGKDYEGAGAEFREAIRLKPDHAGSHNNLGNALFRLRRLEEAVAEFRAAIRLQPTFAGPHNGLGALLCDGKHDYAGATAEFRTAIQLEPTDAAAHNNLGNALRNQGKLDEAIAAFREAIRLKPEEPEVHVKLGGILARQGKFADSVEAFRQALRLRPDDPEAHQGLGRALMDQGKLSEAIAELREAIRLDPNDAAAHNNLGALLCDRMRDNEGAIAEFREAMRLKPNDAEAHYNFGNALSAQGRTDEAIAEFRKAIQLNPNHAQAHCNLGQRLREQGLYAEALAEFRQGHELGSKRPDWRYPSAQWVRDCEQAVALVVKLPAILRDEAQPANAAERIAIASICYDKQLHAAAVRFLREAFQADGKLADDVQAGNRYNAACSAALAGSGKGKDEPAPDEPARVKLRQQALDWLKADLAFWTKQVDSASAQAKALVSQKLQHWKTDSDLAGIREPEALKRLPAEEQKPLRAFWTEVDETLKRAGTQVPKS